MNTQIQDLFFIKKKLEDDEISYVHVLAMDEV